jgi:hypothetical protein
MVEPGIEPGTSCLVVRSSDHQTTRLVEYLGGQEIPSILWNSKGSLPCSQEHAICSFPESDESSALSSTYVCAE